MCWCRIKARKALEENNGEDKAAIEAIKTSTKYDSEVARIADALRIVVRAAQDEERLSLISKSGKPEEETKRTLIFRFISALGYDVFDEKILAGERRILCPIPGTNDNAEKKVDYSIVPARDRALLPQDNSTILFEAKAHTVVLNGTKPGSPWYQLAEYFENAREAELAILTNGKEYRFYGCDPEAAVAGDHKMAVEPFMSFDLSTLPADGETIEELAGRLLHMGFKQFDMTQVDDYTATLKPYMKKKIQSTAYPKALISAIREAVKNTEMVDDDTLVSWFKEAAANEASANEASAE